MKKRIFPTVRELVDKTGRFGLFDKPYDELTIAELDADQMNFRWGQEEKHPSGIDESEENIPDWWRNTEEGDG